MSFFAGAKNDNMTKFVFFAHFGERFCFLSQRHDSGHDAVNLLDGLLLVRLDVLQDQIAKKVMERYEPDNNTGWKDAVLVGFSANLIAADETISYCIDAIKDIADGRYDGQIRKYENGNELSR